MKNFQLQLITAGSTAAQHIAGATDALAGGCRWIQLRMKDMPDSALAEAAEAIAPLCRQFGATFIIDDNVAAVEAFNADGVHLGKNDMPVDEARKILGHGKIIGATANTIDDIRHAARLGADYIGLGPFRFTTTKKNLSPVLGLDGYCSILAQCRREGITAPVVAIGGITASDITGIMDAGADGVAVSGAILNAADRIAATHEIINQLNHTSWIN